jgi:4-amino-4-deoxy-L-arabinose transferase-like glycosyltransferase
MAALLALAAAARLVGIGYGLPYLTYFHDEPQIVLRALRLGTGDLNPHYFAWPGILLMEVALLSYGALFVCGRLAGWWHGVSQFSDAYFRDPTAFYLLARLQSVLSGVWTVWLVARLGSDAYSSTVGWAAALGLAVSALHAHYSHLAHPVVVTTAFITLALWSAVRIATVGGRRDFWIASLALGLGTAAQYHAALAAAPLVIAAGIRGRREGALPRWLGLSLIALAGAVALHLVLSPYTLLDWRQFTHDLTFEARKAAGDPHGHSALGSLTRFARDCMLPSLGLPLALVAGAGVAVALWRRTAADVVLLAFVAEYLVVIGRSAVINDRYGLPLAPVALVLAARALEAGLVAVRDPGTRRAATVALAGLLALPTAISLARTDSAMTLGDTRVSAMRWFESHVPGDSRVVIDMLRFRNTASPPLAENAERLRERLRETASGMEGAGASQAYVVYYQYLLAHPRTPAYYLLSSNMGGDVGPLDSLVARGYSWAVTSSNATDVQELRAAGGDTSGVHWYRELERRATLEHVVSPLPWRLWGPTIRIYRLPATPR